LARTSERAQDTLIVMDEAPHLITRTASVQWQPRPKFYDLRGALIEALESTFGVQRFRVGEHDFMAALLSGTELQVDATGVGLFCVVDPSALDEQAEQLAETVGIIATLLDCQITQTVHAFQHIIAWDVDVTLDEAYRTAVAALFGAEVRDAHAFTDTAVLMDGTRASGGRFQVEFGVIDQEQAPLRLLRKAGRITAMKPSAPDELMRLQFPPVATFTDSTWFPEFDWQPSGDVSSMVRSSLDGAEREANDLANALHLRIAANVLNAAKETPV
jgi:hypothetical protein